MACTKVCATCVLYSVHLLLSAAMYWDSCTEWHAVNKNPCLHAIDGAVSAVYLPVLDPPWQHTAVGQPC